jgi:hypothetical protein
VSDRGNIFLVDESRAAVLGQMKAFHIDVSRVARLPLSSDYFPDMHDGIIPVFGLDRSLVEAVIRRQRDLIDAGYSIVPIDLISGQHPKP